uniref:Exportin-2 n=1 Tax=Setaria digitata TaxID=48799 RepID=A0A915PJA9_9BILA
MAEGAKAVVVAECLKRTLEPNAQVRRNAENELKQMEQLPGFGMVCFDLIFDQQMLPAVVLASAVSLKNFVKENWNKEKCMVEINDGERAQLRARALESMLSTSGNIQKQLSQVVCVMGKHDFPEEWPDLIVVLAKNLSGINLDRLTSTLYTLDELCKKYRYEVKSNKLWQELVIVLQAVAAPLTDLFAKMVECIPNKDMMSAAECQTWIDVTTLITKCFHSLCSQDLPEYFEDHLSTWINGFMALLKLQIPQLDTRSIDSEANVLDKLKCCICEIITLYSQRYEEEIMPFMMPNDKNLIMQEKAEQRCWLIECAWQLLVSIDQKPRYDTLVNASLGFLSSVCQRSQYSAIFEHEEMLKTLYEDVIIKNVMLRECDFELFEDDPLEYMRRDIEGSDIGTRRRGASDFLRALCRRPEEPRILGILSEVLQSFLQESVADLTNNWLKKDVVYCLITAVAVKAETVKHGATVTSDLVDVVDFYQTHVHTDLFMDDIDALPILKTNALKYIVIFRNHLRPDQLVELVGAFLKLLSSRHTILHQYVAYALERLMLVRCRETGKVLLTHENLPVGPLIVALFTCFETNPKAQNSHYLMKALLRCFNIIDTETAKSSAHIVDKLATMIGVAVKNPVDPLHIHYVFESLCVLIRQVYGVVDGGIEKFVMPLIESIFSSDAVDFVPYALQITALLLDQAEAERQKTGTSCVNSYLPFFGNLMKEELWLRTANIPAALLVIESFMCSHAKHILDNYANSLLAVFQKLISSKALDQYGFQLASIFLRYVNQADVLTESALMIPMLRRIQFTKTTKFMKNFVLFLARFAIIRGSLVLYQVLELIQTGMFMMVVEKILIPELSKMCSTTTYDEKRLCCIGFANLAAEMVDKLGQVTYPHLLLHFRLQYGILVESLVRLVEASGSGPTPLNSDDIEECGLLSALELERNDPFCKLSYAQHSDVVAAEVVNFKAYLAEAIMVRAVTRKADSASCINEEIRSFLAGYAQQV